MKASQLVKIFGALCLVAGCASHKKNDQQNYTYFMQVGSEYMASTYYMEAKQAYEKALELSPKDYGATYKIGEVLVQIKDFAGAEKWMTPLCQSHPREATCAHLLSIIELQLGHLNAAERYLGESVKLGYESKSEEVYELRARILMARKKNYLAKVTVTEGIQSNPTSCSLNLLKVQVLVADRAMEDALEQTKIFTDMCPSEPVGHAWEAFLYLQTRQKALAQEKLRKIVEVFAGTPAEVYSRESLRNIEQGVPMASPAPLYEW